NNKPDWWWLYDGKSQKHSAARVEMEGLSESQPLSLGLSGRGPTCIWEGSGLTSLTFESLELFNSEVGSSKCTRSGVATPWPASSFLHSFERAVDSQIKNGRTHRSQLVSQILSGPANRGLSAAARPSCFR